MTKINASEIEAAKAVIGRLRGSFYPGDLKQVTKLLPQLAKYLAESETDVTEDLLMNYAVNGVDAIEQKLTALKTAKKTEKKTVLNADFTQETSGQKPIDNFSIDTGDPNVVGKTHYHNKFVG